MADLYKIVRPFVPVAVTPGVRITPKDATGGELPKNVRLEIGKTTGSSPQGISGSFSSSITCYMEQVQQETGS